MDGLLARWNEDLMGWIHKFYYQSNRFTSTRTGDVRYQPRKALSWWKTSQRFKRLKYYYFPLWNLFSSFSHRFPIQPKMNVTDVHSPEKDISITSEDKPWGLLSLNDPFRDDTGQCGYDYILHSTWTFILKTISKIGTQKHRGILVKIGWGASFNIWPPHF